MIAYISLKSLVTHFMQGKNSLYVKYKTKGISNNGESKGDESVYTSSYCNVSVI